MISRRELESVRSYEMRVSPVDASLSKSIVTLNNEPTTPNLRLSLNAQGADGIDSSGAAGRKKTGEQRDSK